MARLAQQNDWRKLLDDNFEILQESLHLTNGVIEHLRRESVISETECQTLVAIKKRKKLVRARELLNILRTDVAGVRFRELVAVLQIRKYRCLSAAKLFRDFAKNQFGLETEGWIPEGEESDDGSSSALFMKPSQMPIDSTVKYIGSFNFDASLPSSHLSRPTEINKIRTKLNDAACNCNIARPKIAIVSGIGGIGKSTLARLFALHLQRTIEVDNVIWIPAATVEAIVSTFARLALTEFNIESYSDSDDKKTPLPPERFLPQLYRRLFQGRTLLIFDNAEGLSEEELHQFIPASITPGQQWRPLILVTSRPNNWKLLNNNVLDLGYLEAEDGADYVMNRLGRYCPNRQEAQKLVKFYGNLIIALEASAAAIMKTNRERENGTQPQLYTVSDHLKEVEERQVKLQNAKGFFAAVKSLFWKTPSLTIEIGPEYKKLESLWSMSFEKVESEKAGRLALDVLDLCSCLDVDEIPVQILELIWSPTETQLLAAIQLLKDFSLITSFEITSFETSGRNHSIRLRLHRVLQKIRWNCLKSPEAIINIVKQVVTAADCFLSHFDFDVLEEPDARSMYRCLNELVPTLTVFVKSEAVLQYLPDVNEELVYRSLTFNCLSSLKNSGIDTNDRLLKLKYEYLEVLDASVYRISIPDDVDFAVLELVKKVSALTNLNSAKEKEKQVLLAKLQLLLYRILANRNSPSGIDPVEFCRASQRLCDQPRTPSANFWATYECGQHLITHYTLELEFQNVHVIWNDLKKHGIGKHTDPVTARYFNVAQKRIMWTYLLEGKLDEALETLDCEINGRQLGHVDLKYEKLMLARLLACVGDYDAGLQLFHEADQIDKIEFRIDYSKPCFLTFARGVPEAKYFQQVTDEFMEKCSPAERQKFRQSYMNSNSLDSVRQILAPETDDNLRKSIQTQNVFSPARLCSVESATNEHIHELLVLYNKSKEFYRNGDLSSVKTSLEAGHLKAAEFFGKYAPGTYAFRYKLGIVLRDQWMSTKDSGLLEEALAIFISLVTRFCGVLHDAFWEISSSPFNTFGHKCCHALGTVLFYTSDFNLAVQVFYTVWTHKRVIRGEDHKSTFESKLWYARTLNKLGRKSEAVAILEEIVRDVSRECRKTDEIFHEAQDLLSSLKV